MPYIGFSYWRCETFSAHLVARFIAERHFVAKCTCSRGTRDRSRDRTLARTSQESHQWRFTDSYSHLTS